MLRGVFPFASDASILDAGAQEGFRVAELPEEAKEFAENQLKIMQTLRHQTDQLRIFGELLRQVVQLLTPEDKPREGPSLAEMIAELVRQLQVTNETLKDVADTTARSMVEIPVAVAALFKEANPSA